MSNLREHLIKEGTGEEKIKTVGAVSVKFTGEEFKVVFGILGLFVARKDLMNYWTKDPKKQKEIVTLWHKLGKKIKLV